MTPRASSADFVMPISRRLFSIAIFLGLAIGSAAGAETLGKTLLAKVVTVVDGDTLRVMINGGKKRSG